VVVHLEGIDCCARVVNTGGAFEGKRLEEETFVEEVVGEVEVGVVAQQMPLEISFL